MWVNRFKRGVVLALDERRSFMELLFSDSDQTRPYDLMLKVRPRAQKGNSGKHRRTSCIICGTTNVNLNRRIGKKLTKSRINKSRELFTWFLVKMIYPLVSRFKIRSQITSYKMPKLENSPSKPYANKNS